MILKWISTSAVKNTPVLSWDTVSYIAHCYFGIIIHYEDVALFIVIAGMRPQPKRGKLEHSYSLQPNPIRRKIERNPDFTTESAEVKVRQGMFMLYILGQIQGPVMTVSQRPRVYRLYVHVYRGILSLVLCSCTVYQDCSDWELRRVARFHSPYKPPKNISWFWFSWCNLKLQLWTLFPGSRPKSLTKRCFSILLWANLYVKWQ